MSKASAALFVVLATVPIGAFYLGHLTKTERIEVHAIPPPQPELLPEVLLVPEPQEKSVFIICEANCNVSKLKANSIVIESAGEVSLNNIDISGSSGVTNGLSYGVLIIDGKRTDYLKHIEDLAMRVAP